MKEWVEYDTYVEKEFIEIKRQLKARLSVLLAKGEISYSNSDEVQRVFKDKYNVEPSLEEIEDMLQVLEYEEKTPVSIDDFFPGY